MFLVSQGGAFGRPAGAAARAETAPLAAEVDQSPCLAVLAPNAQESMLQALSQKALELKLDLARLRPALGSQDS